MPKLYQQGANLERKQCHEAISGGALVAMRGAGSKCYSKENKYKIDTIFIYEGKIVLCQQKKRGTIPKRELMNLIDLQRKLPSVTVSIGTNRGITPVNELISLMFKTRV